ncbi:MAG TPA: hypothetical protein VHS32_30870, partial [Streptosporangiaceae bacterium]|nr:hypothetical protein [Streptosporangiaceae bacterium]
MTGSAASRSRSRCPRPAWSSTAITRRTRVDQRRCQRAASGAQVEHQITGTYQREFDDVACPVVTQPAPAPPWPGRLINARIRPRTQPGTCSRGAACEPSSR